MRRGQCRHWRGVSEPICGAGVVVRDRDPDPGMPGLVRRLPCVPFYHDAKFGTVGQCDLFEEPTDAEIAAHKAAIDAEEAKSDERMRLVAPLIARVKREYKGHSWSGAVECPVCHGTLHLTHAGRNWHVHGRCETEGCVAWVM